MAYLTKEEMMKRPSIVRREWAFSPKREKDDPIGLKKSAEKFGHDRPTPGSHRFYRLPEFQRVAALNYFDALCVKHRERILHTPNFTKILHMITLNRFKNPGQPNAAARLRKYKPTSRRGFKSYANAQKKIPYTGPRSSQLPT